MNKLSLNLLLVALGLLATFNSVFAATYGATGKVDIIRGHYDIEWTEDVDWMTVHGFTNGGTCKLSGGKVVMRIPHNKNGKRMFAIAMAAKISERKVEVGVQDNNVDSSGYCILRYIDIR